MIIVTTNYKELKDMMCRLPYLICRYSQYLNYFLEFMYALKY